MLYFVSILDATISQSLSLELLHDILSGWPKLFRETTIFRDSIKNSIIPSINFLLKRLQEDYVLIVKSGNIASQTNRTVRIARCLLLDYFDFDFYEAMDSIMNHLILTLIVERDMEVRLSYTVDEFGKFKTDETFANIQGIAAGTFFLKYINQFCFLF